MFSSENSIEFQKENDNDRSKTGYRIKSTFLYAYSLFNNIYTFLKAVQFCI